jgi:uncharacterized phage protein (TIGR01671 family)
MRAIKFRGKRLDNGEWIEGLLLTNNLGTYIITEKNPHECTQYGYLEINEYGRVDPETVRQYTGLTDRNGKEIYEGDIVTAREQSTKATFTGYVHYLNAQYWVNYIGYESYYVPLIQLHGAEYKPIEVIGNIYSNPELVST